MSESALCNPRSVQKSQEKKREINILGLFDHESMKIAFNKGFYDNGVLKELQLRSKEK